MVFIVQLFIVELVGGLVAVDGDSGHKDRLGQKKRVKGKRDRGQRVRTGLWGAEESLELNMTREIPD
jgi:hypothetical protein